MKNKRLLYFLSALFVGVSLLAATELPDYKGPINDLAGVLSRSEISQLEQKAIGYRDQTGSEIGVLIVPTLGDYALENYAHDVFKKWGIGQKGKDNGVLFLVAIGEHKARVEVGYGLEGELTDLESGRLVNKNSPMAEAFRADDYAGGVNVVLDGIVQAIGGEYNPPKPKKKGKDKIPPLAPLAFIIFFIVMAIIRRASSVGRRFGGPFIGGGMG